MGMLCALKSEFLFSRNCRGHVKVVDIIRDRFGYMYCTAHIKMQIMHPDYILVYISHLLVVVLNSSVQFFAVVLV
jgi:hypothetical protein